MATVHARLVPRARRRQELDAGYRSRLARHEARTRADRDGTRAHGTSVQHDGGDVGRARARGRRRHLDVSLDWRRSEGRIISRDDVRFSHGLRRSQRRRHRRARDARRTRLHGRDVDTGGLLFGFNRSR